MDYCVRHPYSVLMSVYDKEKPEYLKTAMESMWSQSFPPDDFVLVCDGPLRADLEGVIAQMRNEHPDTLRVVALEKNEGLAHALNVGIKFCKHELVARMDSDDISRPERCGKQLQIFAEYPEVSIVSGTVEEFSTSTDKIETRRKLPLTQAEIVAFAKKRNPFNHPCVMYKRSAVEEAGGYQDLYLMEDYYLWVRMLQKGAVGRNLQEPLLWMRAGPAMYRRRSGLKYAQSQRQLFQYMRRSGFITPVEYAQSVLVRGISSLLPNKLRALAFKYFTRR